ncbi:MAG: DUF4276 family protein [Pirellulaceae bacterium]|nr:DUF4276 family protein [Pirellulaceae bacterium]
MRRLVLFCEGQGDELGVWQLTKRVLAPSDPWRWLVLDDAPFRTGDVSSLFKSDFSKWLKLLTAARKRPEFAGVVAVFDGDMDRVNKQPFCPKLHACQLAAAAQSVGAGSTFSLAVIFARQEFESWLIAGVESLAGQRLPPNSRPGVLSGTVAPSGDLELHPRGAKEWLSKAMEEGYLPTRDQGVLAKLVALDPIRNRNLRSFSRFESAIVQIASAIQHNKHIATPS